MAETINDINNLKFYTAKGYEIPMQKSYVLTWELIPGKLASQYIKSPISGYFIGDIDFNDPSQLKIKEGTLETAFINQGQIYIRFATNETTDINGMPVYSYDNVDTETNLLDASCYYDYLNRILLDDENQVKVAINIKNKSFTYTFGVGSIFELTGDASTYQDYTTVSTIYTGENLDQNQEFYQMIGVSKVDLIKYEDETGTIYNNSVIQQVFEDTVPNLGIYFPFIRYAGDYYQDKVSADFIAADTILVLEEVRNEDDTYDYVRPFINGDSGYSLIFQPSKNSELKLIDKSSEYNILYKDEMAFTMANPQTSKDVAEPFSFTIAFQAEEEGAYQNLLGIYLAHGDNREHIFFMGAISIKSEVVGEDERFRTLLTNFGVPDPINYSNIFAEQDYQEEGKDFDLINRKSKELMLTYDQIFSYVGTYKALFRAIKFLGYQDIVFKEWYTIKDHNDQLTDIAVQVFDSSTGSFLKQKLADYGISIEDFNNYDKLNKISMIYHLNEISDNVEKVKVQLSQYNPSTGHIDVSTAVPRTFISEVPLTQPVYIYRTDEILAKLFAVKQWLEQHIIGLGAYISDITGEGVYFGWQKTQGYSTQHYLNDFSQAQYYTPDVKCVLPFIESHGKIACTLNELNNAVRFIDYDETQIAAFNKYDVSINLSTDDGTMIDTSILTISNSIEAPVLGDEYEFDLVNRPKSGTLYEWTMGDDSSAQILIQDGEIKILKDKDTEAYIDSSCLPIITLENANIHNAYGNWRSNIKWLIREAINNETGNIEYELKNYQLYQDINHKKVDNKYIVIEPDIKVDASGNIINMPYIKYSEKNKWDAPMFIINGYKFSNVEFNSSLYIGDSSNSSMYIDEHEYYNLENASCDFILEILKGDMLFRDKDGCSCQVSFSSDLIKNGINKYANEQEIQPTYTYHSERKPFVNINLNPSTMIHSLDTSVECSNVINDLSTSLKEGIDNAYEDMRKRMRSWYLPGLNGLSHKDIVDFKSSSTYIQDESTFLNTCKVIKKQEILNSSLEQIINDNYICNKTIDVDITRLGQYELITRAFDKYNNIFTSKYDNTIDVVAAPIPIDTFICNENSNNEYDFYSYNKNGVLQDVSQLNEIIALCDNNIKYPKSYHIYNIDYNLDGDYVEFDNISYAFDTPKNNDIVIFDTLTERCVNIENVSNGNTRLWMLDENPNKIGLYTDVSILRAPIVNSTPDASMTFNVTKKISAFAYNQLTKKIEYQIENCSVLDFYKIDENKDNNYNADSFIDISINNCSLSDYIDDEHKIFVLNTTEYPFNQLCIELNYDSKETYVTFLTDKKIFNDEDVIKLRYYMDISTNNQYPYYSSSIGSQPFDQFKLRDDMWNAQIINETTYRIKNISPINYNEIDKTCDGFVYTIDGLPNTNLLNNPDVNVVMMYDAQHPVRYSTNIVGNAYEFNQIISIGDYSIIRDRFDFSATKLFLNDYIDDKYGIEVNDYDYMNGEKYWVNYHKYIQNSSDMSIYYYHQFPTTIEQGTDTIFRSHNSNNTFKEGYKKEWRVAVKSVDDLSNTKYHINNNHKETLFRSVNDHLTITPYMLGSHDIELTCTDIYGNRLVNLGEGLLFVKENQNGEYQNYSYI